MVNNDSIPPVKEDCAYERIWHSETKEGVFIFESNFGGSGLRVVKSGFLDN